MGGHGLMGGNWMGGHGTSGDMVEKSRALPVMQQTSDLIGCHPWIPLF